ncbi:hypothetical protein BS47DRAFT_834033 [Hydnum rufescens UP504]|uniref:Uncharacterized protein n=1 Tax=Hydnum rufescens UP504 TaxID=1448309 RepID=A0A9P6DU16_9AGAM|nr:hypothetical protein BS47DRAFT_834033 [Hydnum rufescens UP504]
MWIFSIKLVCVCSRRQGSIELMRGEKKDEGKENMEVSIGEEQCILPKGNHAYVLAITYPHCRLSVMRYLRSAREGWEDNLRIAQIVFGKREVSAHSIEYQREENMARKQKVTQRQQYHELIDIAESHEGDLLFAHCIFAATWGPRDTHNRGT